MILLVIAFALGVAALTYETLPKVRARVDEHFQALRAALSAHRETRTRLALARTERDPMTAAEHVHRAGASNQAAARETTRAADTAATAPEREAVATSATTVIKQSDEIKRTLDQLGFSQCDVRSYGGVTPVVRDALLAKLREEKMDVTGANPWDIDTHEHGVKLRAVWDPRTQVVKVIVTTGKNWLVTCDRIWERIDPIMNEVIGS